MKVLDATLRPITLESGIRALVWTLIPIVVLYIAGVVPMLPASLLFGVGFGSQLMVSAGITPLRTPVAFCTAFGLLVIALGGPLYPWLGGSA